MNQNLKKVLNYATLGERAKVLLDLHLESPKKFTAEMILEELFKEYERQGFTNKPE